MKIKSVGRKLLIVCLSVLIAVDCYGEAASSKKDDPCDVVSSLAQSIMLGRQSGVSMSKMISATEGAIDPTASDLSAGKDLAKKMIIEAYDSPRYSTESIKQRTVEDFRDAAYLGCIKGIEAGKKHPTAP